MKWSFKIGINWFIACIKNDLWFIPPFHNPDALLFEPIKKKCDFLIQVDLFRSAGNYLPTFKLAWILYVIFLYGYSAFWAHFLWVGPSSSLVGTALLLSDPKIPIFAHAGRKYGKSNCIIITLQSSLHPLHTNKSHNKICESYCLYSANTFNILLL